MLPKKLSLLIALLFLTAIARAENILQVGYGEGLPGDTDIDVIVTATNDEPIHGYSLALSFPAEALELVELSVDGTHVAPMHPDFVAPTHDNELGIAVLGVILGDLGAEFDPELVLEATPAGGSPRILARLRFDVRDDAPGGLYPLRLIDGIGTPAGVNSFTRAGARIAPQLVDGLFLIEGGNLVTLDKNRAVCAQTVRTTLTAYTQHALPLEAFSIGISYECRAFEGISATIEGTVMEAQVGPMGQPGGVEFLQTDFDESLSPTLCRARLAAIFDRLPPFDGQSLPPSLESPTAQSVAKFTFGFKPAFFTPTRCQDLSVLDFRLEELSQPGALNTTFVIDGNSITPRRNDGKVYFSTGVVIGRVLDAVTGEGIGDVNVVSYPDRFSATTVADGSFRLESVIPGEYSLRIGKRGYYSTLGTGVRVRGFDQVDDAGDFAIYRIPPAPPPENVPFRRGFVNDDARLDVSDAVSILNYLFQGAGEPACLNAANANGDDRIDITDGIFVLGYLFLAGGEPPPPFAECGPEGNPDEPPLHRCRFSAACEG